MTQHTPGPWSVYHSDTPEFSGHVIHCGGPARLALVPLDSVSAEANASLIAAAPDLLAALAYCLPRVHRHLADEAELAKVRAAIAKVEGKP